MITLEVHNLSVRFGKKQILKNLSLTAKEGDLIGILGVNGAGKTTLFKNLYYQDFDEGRVLFKQKPLFKDDISFIESTNTFYPFLTAKEFLSLIDIGKSEFSAILMENFNVPKHTYIENLSTGERKKLAIITGILNKKYIYLLDEPFNGLDYESYELLKKILQSSIFSDKITFISSHILGSLTEICTKILHLKNGEILEEFTPDNYYKITQIYNIEIEQKLRQIEELYRNVT